MISKSYSYHGTYLSLLIPDFVETEATLGVIEKAEILPSLWD
jgi:hypothetical protein